MCNNVQCVQLVRRQVMSLLLSSILFSVFLRCSGSASVPAYLLTFTTHQPAWSRTQHVQRKLTCIFALFKHCFMPLVSASLWPARVEKSIRYVLHDGFPWLPFGLAALQFHLANRFRARAVCRVEKWILPACLASNQDRNLGASRELSCV